jgi:hypothetical protein
VNDFHVRLIYDVYVDTPNSTAFPLSFFISFFWKLNTAPANFAFLMLRNLRSCSGPRLPQHLDRKDVVCRRLKNELRIAGPAFDFLTEVRAGVSAPGSVLES